jgi:ERF superfamily
MATAQQPLSSELIPSGASETLKSLTETFSPGSLLSIALQNNAAIDVIERLAALQEKTMLRDAEILFSDALSRAQAEIKRVAPDLQNPQTSSKYASYAAIDRVIRPIYTKEGMSLSFSHADCPKADHVRVLCYASLGAYTRTYQIDMPADGKGAKGGDVMTKTHATAAADSYAKRYLVKDIFNIAIGEDDRDGNSPTGTGIPSNRVQEMLSEISRASTFDQLWKVYKFAYREAHDRNDQAALAAYIRAKDVRKRELQ